MKHKHLCDSYAKRRNRWLAGLTTPSAPLWWLRGIFFVAQPPLLCEEGNISVAALPRCAFLWLFTFFFAALSVSCGRLDAQKNAAAWEHEAQNVSIVRDNWGIPHVSGKTDADVMGELTEAIVVWTTGVM